MMVNQVGRSMIKKLMFAVPMFILFACTPPITEGTIIAKRYEPERRWTSTIYITVGKVQVPSIIHNFDDEDWIIVIDGINEKGKTDRRELEISPQLYEKLSVGDYYKIPSESEENIEQIDENKEWLNR